MMSCDLVPHTLARFPISKFISPSLAILVRLSSSFSFSLFHNSGATSKMASFFFLLVVLVAVLATVSAFRPTVRTTPMRSSTIVMDGKVGTPFFSLFTLLITLTFHPFHFFSLFLHIFPRFLWSMLYTSYWLFFFHLFASIYPFPLFSTFMCNIHIHLYINRQSTILHRFPWAIHLCYMIIWGHL